MHKKLQDFRKEYTGIKNLTLQTKKNEDLKAKVLNNAGDHFNELYYIYKKDIKKKR